MYNNGYVGFKLFKYVMIFLVALCADIFIIAMFFNKDKIVDFFNDEIFTYEEEYIEDDDYNEDDDRYNSTSCKISVSYFLENIEYDMDLNSTDLRAVTVYYSGALNNPVYNVENEIGHYDYKITSCDGKEYYLDNNSNYMDSENIGSKRYFLKSKIDLFEIFRRNIAKDVNMYLYDTTTNKSIEFDDLDEIKILNIMNDVNKYEYVYEELPITGKYMLVVGNSTLYFDDYNSSYYRYYNNTIDFGYELGQLLKKYSVN